MTHTASHAGAAAFPARGPERMLILGGLLLILAGMIFGDIFAVFVLHQNAGRISEDLLGATRAVAAGNPAGAQAHFARIGGALENRGTKVDAHVHIIVFGYLALLLALVQPYVALSEPARARLAALFLTGATVLPVAVFVIHYAGLAYSPLADIGWASMIADFAGLLVILAGGGELAGILKRVRGVACAARPALPFERSWSSRALLAGGTLLVLAGFLHGAGYAAVLLNRQAEQDLQLLQTMATQAAAGNNTQAERAAAHYGFLQGQRAVHIAAHAHIIEFGILAMLAACIQPFVFLSERWKRRWAAALLAGSVILPVFVLAEIRWGLVAGGIADVGGLLVVLGLTGMLAGVVRYTGRADAQA